MGVEYLCHDYIPLVSVLRSLDSMTWHLDVVLAKGDYIGSVVKLRSLRLRCIAGFWVSVAIQNLKERTHFQYRYKTESSLLFSS